MCGIVGIISRNGNVSDLNMNDMDAFKAMLVMDTIRGEDSTGAFTVLRNQQIAGVKQADVPHNLFRQKAWTEFSNKAHMSGRFLVGHNRKATQGLINPDNAHPFNEGAITLVHNGTLRNHRALAAVDVDSQAVARAFSERDYREVIGDIDGAFAFVWYDSRDQKLRMVRNDERPLGIIETKSRYIFASEIWMAHAAGQRFGLIDDKEKKVLHSLAIIKAGTVISIDSQGTLDSEEIELPKKPVVFTTHYGRNYGGDVQERVHGRHNTAEATPRLPLTSAPAGNSGPTSESEKDEQALESIERTIDKARMATAAYTFREVIAIRFDSASKIGTFTRLQGKTVHPGKPTVDVAAVLPIGTSLDDAQRYIIPGVLCSGVVAEIHNTVCGPSIKVLKVEDDLTFRTDNGVKLSETQWYAIVEENACHVCGDYIDDDDVLFSNVKRKGSTYRCTCPNCVEKSITSKEKKDEFIKRRIVALENRERISSSAHTSAVGDNPPPSTSSLH